MNKKRLSLGKLLLNIVTAAMVLITLFPLVWLLSTATKTKLDAFAIPPVFIYKPILDSFRDVLGKNDFIASYWNSLVVVAGVTLFSLVLGIPSAYAITRTRFKGAKIAGLWMILSRMVPPMGFVLPMYLIFSRLKMLDTYVALVLVDLTISLPFVTWLMMGFFRQVPEEIEDSARIDGCSRIETLFRITIPLVTPGIVTCAIFSFITSWNEYFYALIISGRNTRTAPVVIQGFVSFSGLNWGQLSAAGLLVALPVLLFSLFVQRGLVKGLMGGGIK